MLTFANSRNFNLSLQTSCLLLSKLTLFDFIKGIRLYLKLLDSYGPESYKQFRFGENQYFQAQHVSMLLLLFGEGITVSPGGTHFQLLWIFLKAAHFQDKSFQSVIPEELLPPCQLVPMGTVMPV